MKLKSFFLSLYLLFLPFYAVAISNVNASLSNRLLWADGTEKEFTSGQSKKLSYFENYFDSRLSIGEKITTGLRISMLQPSYWGERTNGINAIDKRWLQFQSDRFSIRIGHNYPLWGRGLTLALIEDFDQGLDSGIDGVVMNYSLDRLKIEVIRGRSEPDPAGYTQANDIQGANIELDNGFFKISSSILHTLPENYPDFRTAGAAVQSQHHFQNFGTVSLFWEGAWQHEVNAIKNPHRGWFSSISFARKGFSVQLDYKDYQFRLFNGNLLPYQSPPIALRELISKTMSSHPHYPKFDDEIGWQTEVQYKPTKRIGLNFYAAQTSAHHGTPIPSLKQKDSPFTEYMSEINWKVQKNKNVRFLYALRRETLWSKHFNIPTLWNERNGVLVSYQSTLIRRIAFEMVAEYMFTDDKLRKQSFTDGYYNFTISSPGKGSLAFLLETTNDKNQIGGPTWFAVEATYPLQKGMQLQFYSGEQRGGIVCSSGRCRPVNPFKGVRIGVETNF